MFSIIQPKNQTKRESPWLKPQYLLLNLPAVTLRLWKPASPDIIETNGRKRAGPHYIIGSFFEIIGS